MNTAQSTPVDPHKRIDVGGAALDVVAAHGSDWFPLVIECGGRFLTTLYLQREELHALRCRLDEIDEGLPPVGVES